MKTINGIPAHPLFVHFTVVAVPVTALVAILVVVWPRARTYLGVFPPILALVTLIAVPITTSAGEALKDRIPRRIEAVERHAQLGDRLILLVGPLFALMAVWWFLFSPWVAQRITLPPAPLRVLRIVVGIATVCVAVATVILVIQIGDTGARAVWVRRR